MFVRGEGIEISRSNLAAYLGDLSDVRIERLKSGSAHLILEDCTGSEAIIYMDAPVAEAIEAAWRAAQKEAAA